MNSHPKMPPERRTELRSQLVNNQPRLTQADREELAAELARVGELEAALRHEADRFISAAARSRSRKNSIPPVPATDPRRRTINESIRWALTMRKLTAAQRFELRRAREDEEMTQEGLNVPDVRGDRSEEP